MEITEVRVKLVERSSERLRAFCSITLDGDFVIRDLKIIDGASGVFVAMPSRKLSDRCTRCGNKNHLRAKFCNECGQKLNENRAPKDAQGRAKLHADVAHPINAACRERIQNAVVEAYQAELERSRQPGYKPSAVDEFEDFEFEEEKPAKEKPKPLETPPPGDVDADADADTDAPAGDEDEEEESDDYNSLIEDLKKDAEHRRTERDRESVGAGFRDSGPRRDKPRGGDRPPDRGPSRGPREEPRREERPARFERRDDRPASPAPAPPPAPPPPAPTPSSPGPAESDDPFGAGL